jgi:hypothetical protein
VCSTVNKMRHVAKELSTIGDKETGNVSIKQGGVNE